MAPEGESNVVATLEAMAELVRRGDIVEARELGNTCSIPLGVGQQHLKLLEKVADGPASTVWKAEWDGIQVAVKKPRIASSSDLDRFKQELAMLAELAGHRNIARLMGACAVPPNYQMFLEWEEQNLETQIHHFGWRPDWPTVLDMAAQLGEAVSAVHSREILHRDLKPGNVLRSADGCVRLTDFGIAEKVEVLQMMYEVVSQGGRPTVAGPTGGYHKRLMLGTMEYMAPEVLCKQPHSTASDVYALAVTVNELATGTFPFSNCTTENPKAHTILEMHYGRQELAAAVSSEGLRPILPDEAPAGYAELMDRCWAKDPSQRPSADEFLDEVLRIKSHLGDTAVGVAADTYCSNGAASQPPINGAAPVTTVHRHDAGPPARTEGAATSGPQAMDVTTTDRNAAIDLHDLPACADAATWAQGCNAFPCLTAGGYATAGRRGETKMEDRHVIKASFRGMNPCCLLGVFDGHRGWEAAEYARLHLDEAMDQSWREAGNPGALMHRVFERLDEGFEAERSAARREEVERMGAAAGPEVFPGCTAMVALVCGRQLLLAGAGDCRGVLCRAGGAVQLSRDHTADDPEERGRVQGLGGRVEWRVNGWRVGTEGLQVTRSLGDRDLRGDGVTAAPEVVGHVLDERDQFLVLASDGLWDKLSNEEAVGLVLDTVKHPGMAAQRLATEALTRGSQDNITVLVLFLRPVRTLESIFRNGDEKHRITPTLHGSLPILASGPCPDELREQF